MNTLIVMASKYGATREACGRLAQLIEGDVTLVDLSAGETADPSAYDRVLAGGSVYASKLRPDVKHFLEVHRDVLMDKDLGLFLCCADPGCDNRENFMETNIPPELLERARVRGYFGHQFHFPKMNLLERTIVRKIVKVQESEDKLDWEAIEAYAAQVNEVSSVS